MQRNFYYITVLLFILGSKSNAATWEKLYKMDGADCFRDVHELSNGDFIAAGYTNNLNSNDTDGLVMRFQDDGDEIWTYTYDGPSDDEDGFYKGIPTSDGGFILCGFSSSFGGNDNALFIKLNSSGNQQWVRNWGGSGYERARDILELPNGDFVAVGYTSSSPAQGFDAFIMKMDDNGNILWNKIYGSADYDEANSLKRLQDGGFILGGTGSDDLFIVRTDANGDSVWTKFLGTSGVDVIKCLAVVQGNDGFVLSGTTTGLGAGGEDAYLVRTDTGGVVQWSKYYGGPLDDGFQGINKTSDGGYIGIGTSRLGPWPDPNVWLFKLTSSGNISWQRYYGGDEHDHGYSASETDDGGFIVGGHTRSFGDNAPPPDAIIIKTDDNGNVQTQLSFTAVTELVAPVSVTCGYQNAQVIVEITNYSDYTVSNIPVTVEITGEINQTLTQTYASSVDRNETKTITFTTTIDMTTDGDYDFHCYTGNPHDVYPDRNFLDETVTVNSPFVSPPNVNDGTHCGPGTVDLSASSSHSIRWYAAATGGLPLNTGSSFTTPYLTADETFYASAGSTCPSLRVPVDAIITTGITQPAGSDSSRCGPGAIALSASSAYQVVWYDSATATVPLFTGSVYNIPTLDSSRQYYVASENSTCSSNRIQVNAIVRSIPAEPITAGGSHCGDGSVELNAITSDSVLWYDDIAGGNLVGTGDIFNTPLITTSTNYFAQSYDGFCYSNRTLTNAIIYPLPVFSLGPDSVVTSQNNFVLDAGSGFSEYAWSTSETSQTISVNQTGNYCVTVSTLNSCTSTECIFVDFVTGIEEMNSNHFTIYQDQSSGLFTFEYSLRNSPLDFKVVDMTGKVVCSLLITNNKQTLDLSFLARGIYIAHVIGKNVNASKKIKVE